MQHALPVGQPAVHVEMPAVDGVVAVRVLAVAMRIEASGRTGCRDLPAVRVAASIHCQGYCISSAQFAGL